MILFIFKLDGNQQNQGFPNLSNTGVKIFK